MLDSALDEEYIFPCFRWVPTMNGDRPSEVSRLLAAWGEGDGGALERLLPLVYHELRKVAGAQFRGERPDHTLQPTALVHEAFLRLAGQDEVVWQGRAHFFAIAAQAMRRILVDHARRRRAAKRDGGQQVPLQEVAATAVAPARDVLELDRLLTELEGLDARAARVLEQRYFAGSTVEETAEALAVAPATVYRETRFALAWMRRRLEVAG